MRPSTMQVLGRGLKMLCPACGRSPIFERGLELYESCPKCGLALRAREPETWFFMYMTTAAITGVFIALMLYFLPPTTLLRQILLAGAAAASFFCTMKVRKGLAIAFDYLVG